LGHTETEQALSCAFGVAPHANNASGAFGVAAKATVAIDDSAFSCEIADRVNGRAQTIVRGILNGRAYKTGGISCNLSRLTSKFPLGNYRLILKIDTTCNYYAVFNHATNRMLIYSAVGTEATDSLDISQLRFPFLAVGE
jgi:hypothetical protein